MHLFLYIWVWVLVWTWVWVWVGLGRVPQLSYYLLFPHPQQRKMCADKDEKVAYAHQTKLRSYDVPSLCSLQILLVLALSYVVACADRAFIDYVTRKSRICRLFLCCVTHHAFHSAQSNAMQDLETSPRPRPIPQSMLRN